MNCCLPSFSFASLPSGCKVLRPVEFAAKASTAVLITGLWTVSFKFEMCKKCESMFNTCRQEFTYVLHIHAVSCIRHHREGVLTAKVGPFGAQMCVFRTTSNDLCYSNLTFSEFPQLLPVDFPDDSGRKQI